MTSMGSEGLYQLCSDMLWRGAAAVTQLSDSLASNYLVEVPSSPYELEAADLEPVN